MHDDVIELKCLDCQTTVRVLVGGPVVACPTENCGRRIQAWSKRKKDDALSFLKEQPSVRQKEYKILDDGRVITSFFYEEEQRYVIRGLLDLIIKPEALRLLLTGVGSTIELPVILVFPTNDRELLEGVEELTPGIGSLVPHRQEFSFFCHLIRKILKWEDRCRACDAARFTHEVQQLRADGQPGGGYNCWAGMWEVSYPVVVNQILVAVFITGQMFRDSPDTAAAQQEAIRLLEAQFSEFSAGLTLTYQQLRETGMSERHCKLLWDSLSLMPQQPLLINRETLSQIELADARAMDRLVGSKGHEDDVRKRIHDIAGLLDEYLRLLYVERRTLREQRFLNEVSAIVESLPRSTTAMDESVLFDAHRIIKRVCEFSGFRHGAICIPPLTGEHTIAHARWHQNSPSLSGIAHISLQMPSRLMAELEERGQTRYQATEPAVGTDTCYFLTELHRQLHNETLTVTTGWLGSISLLDALPELERNRHHSGARKQFPPKILIALWQRIPWTQYDPGNKISERSVTFFKQLTNELGVGLRLWLSFLGLQQAQEGRRQLVANYVHGLKSAMHVAGAKVELIESLLSMHTQEHSLLGVPDIPSLLARISYDLDSFARQITLTNRFAVLDAGVPDYRISFLRDPAEILAHCIEPLRVAANRRGIVINIVDERKATTPADNKLRVRCDPEAIEVAFSALIDNAVKYSFDERSVDVRMAQEGKNLLIDISDFGQGIPAGEEARIFEKFFRGSQTDPRRYVPGTGIGLTVAKDVIEAHGGHIIATSTRGDPPSGKSTSGVRGFKVVFSVVIPVYRPK